MSDQFEGKVLFAWNAPKLPDGVVVENYYILIYEENGVSIFPPHIQPGSDLCVYVGEYRRGELAYRVSISATTSDNGFTKVCSRDFLTPPFLGPRS